MQKIRVFDLINKNTTIRELKQKLLKLPAFTPVFAATGGGKILYSEGLRGKECSHIAFMIPVELFRSFMEELLARGMNCEKLACDSGKYIICLGSDGGLLMGAVSDITEKGCDSLREFYIKIITVKDFINEHEKRLGIYEQKFELSRLLREKAWKLEEILKLSDREKVSDFKDVVFDMTGAAQRIAAFMEKCGVNVNFTCQEKLLVSGVTPFFAKICVGAAGLAAAWSWDNSINVTLKRRDEDGAVLTFSCTKERREFSRLYEQYFKNVFERNDIPFSISHQNGVHISFYFDIAVLRAPLLKESERLGAIFDNELMLEETKRLAKAILEI